MRRDLKGRVILVTGASRGIGRRTAESLAPHGAKLALTSRSTEELAMLADSLKAKGVEVECFPSDLTDPVSFANSLTDTRYRTLAAAFSASAAAQNSAVRSTPVTRQSNLAAIQRAGPPSPEPISSRYSPAWGRSNSTSSRSEASTV